MAEVTSQLVSTSDTLARALHQLHCEPDCLHYQRHEPEDAAHARALLDSGAIRDVASLGDDWPFVHAVAQQMSVESFEDLPLDVVVQRREDVRTVFQALAKLT